ncbi:MAG TPA: phosphatidylglycerophosphatase A [Bryobacteraceae bacterium]|nr:phosphatidylglycerophosphatase A [Bryobacteraceae bacterium]
MKRLSVWLATWFGCGYFPYGPGTVGSLAALVIAGALWRYIDDSRLLLFLLILLLTGPAVWASTRTARAFEKKDPGIVVVDEVLGQWVTLLGAPHQTPVTLLIGFLLFRLFDIWKPPPVRQLEKLPEGLGIVADDIAAGIYAALILYIGGLLRLY